MRSNLHVRLMLVIAPTLIITAFLLAFFLRQETVSQFVVYLSSQEQLERFDPQDRVLLRIYGERIAHVFPFAEREGLNRIVDNIAQAVGREVIVARNEDRFYASSRLRRMELDLRVNESGTLVGHISDERLGVEVDLELPPVVTHEITPFSVDESRPSDVARIYGIPRFAGDPDSERRFVSHTTEMIVLLTAAAAAVMLILISAVVAQSLSPIRRLTAASNAVRRGQTPQPVDVRGTSEVEDLANAFNEMVRSVRNAEASRMRLLADISHELRGPLSNLRSQIEAMQDGLLHSDATTLGSLHEETMLLARLVDDLHELTLADAESLGLEMQSVAPASLVEGAVKSLRAEMVAAGIDLRVDVSEELPTVRVDAQRMGQVLRNVLQNSIRYSGAGSISIRASSDGSHLLLEVADTGVGVEPHEHELIFDRFYRCDPSRTRASGGSGLGLSIARAIVLAHGGTISASSNEPSGLAISIGLPVAGE
ncbi:MAG TPA: ATP-binding protein [Spirochaetia bacterium]|nr:ATP-binding protein [Spirochaetia bacterium]